jgi:hypothetical protein
VLQRHVVRYPHFHEVAQVVELHAAIANVLAICFVRDGKEGGGILAAAMRAPLFKRKIRILTDFQVRRIS